MWERIKYHLYPLFGATVFSGRGLNIIIICMLTALWIRTIAYEPFNIPSSSMAPTLMIGDYLFVAKFAYGYSHYSLPFDLPLFSGRILWYPPQRGDVVVFRKPTDPSLDFIRRIVGLPGDTIQIRYGQLYINNQLVPRRAEQRCKGKNDSTSAQQQGFVESLPRGQGEAPVEHCIVKYGDNGTLDGTGVYTVPPEQYFVMADNRDRSEDSRARSFGYIPAENLIGRAEFLFMSRNAVNGWVSEEPFEFEPAQFLSFLRNPGSVLGLKWPFGIRLERIFQRVR
jgi:signal peptidase I